MKKVLVSIGFLMLASVSEARITSILGQPAGDRGEIQFNNGNFDSDPNLTFSTQTKVTTISSGSFTTSLKLPAFANSTMTCTSDNQRGQVFIDTNTTTGRQLYVCEGASGWVLQGDGSGSATTTDVPEGTNLYFTTARATTAISATAPISNTNGVIAIDKSSATLLGAAPTTTSIPEGTNLYYTVARTTTDISASAPLVNTSGNLTLTNNFPPDSTSYASISAASQQSGSINVHGATHTVLTSGLHITLTSTGTTLTYSSGTVTNFSANIATAATKFTTNRSDSIVQYGVNESKSGMHIGLDDRVFLLSRGVTSYFNNETGQNVSGYDGTACLPAWTTVGDAGSGYYLHQSDVMGFSAGCSTAAIMGQVRVADYQDDAPLQIFGGSRTTSGWSTRVEFHIYTSSASTTPNKIADLNELSALVIVSGRNTAYTAGFTDLLLTGFFNPTPVVVSSHSALGSPSSRTYSSGGSGILRLTMGSGDYLIQTAPIKLTGK